jgi:hypothetical protein
MNQFVAVGSGGAIYSSPDGTSWTRELSGITNQLNSVTLGGGRFVAVGGRSDDQVILTSDDGKNWARQTNGDSRPLYSVTFAKGLFVAVGGWYELSGNPVFTSPDGVAWTRTTIATTQALRGIAYGNGVFVAVGAVPGSGAATSAAIVTSLDGANWEKRSNGVAAWLTDVSFGDGTFVAVGFVVDRFGGGGAGLIWTSDDGITWVRQNYFDFALNGVLCVGDACLVVGNASMILYTGELPRNPRFLPGSVGRMADGSVHLTLESRTNAVITIEASFDLMNWQAIFTSTNQAGILEFRDEAATNLGNRFYRAQETAR